MAHEHGKPEKKSEMSNQILEKVNSHAVSSIPSEYLKVTRREEIEEAVSFFSKKMKEDYEALKASGEFDEI